MKNLTLLALAILVFGCKNNATSSETSTSLSIQDTAKGVVDTLARETSLSIPAKDSLPIDDTLLQQTTKSKPKDKSKPTHKTTTYPNILDLKYITGKFDQRKHPDFVRLKEKYCAYPDMYLRKEVYAAFLKMHNAAQEKKINLIIRSATRNFFTQRRIWENKWTGRKKLAGGENLAKTTKSSLLKAKKILRYSSMPGSSRHHWGTDIDLNDLANSYFETGKGYKMYQWMKAHAHEFGFYQVYTEKGPERPTGYNEERWHWTYLPTSKKILEAAKQKLKDEDFSGFLGANTAPKIHIVRDYVLGINKACL